MEGIVKGEQMKRTYTLNKIQISLSWNIVENIWDNLNTQLNKYVGEK